MRQLSTPPKPTSIPATYAVPVPAPKMVQLSTVELSAPPTITVQVPGPAAGALFITTWQSRKIALSVSLTAPRLTTESPSELTKRWLNTAPTPRETEQSYALALSAASLS